jgi:hypothetical protein
MKTRLTVIAFSTTILASCAGSPSPNHDAQFGQNARILRAQQVIDPNAPKRNTGLGTTDGKSVAGIHKKYVEGSGYAVQEGTAPPAQIIVAPTTNTNR